MPLHCNHTLTGHNGPIYDCAVLDERSVFSSSGDRYIVRWDILEGQQTGFAIKVDLPAYALHYASEWKKLFIGSSNGTITCVDPFTKKEKWAHNYIDAPIYSLLSLQDQEILLAGSSNGTLFILKADGKLLGKITLGEGKIRKLSEDNNLIYCGLQSGLILQIDRSTLSFIHEWQAHDNGVNCFVLEDDMLWSGGKDGRLKYWDTKSYVTQLNLPAHYQTIYGMVKCGQEHLITVSMDKTIKCWEIETMKVIQRIEGGKLGHVRSVNGIVSNKNNYFISFSDDKTLRVWEWGN